MAAVFAAAEQPVTTPLKATPEGAAVRDRARGCAASLGTLAHAANLVVNQTLLPMVFGQLGTQETLPLPPRRECGYAWRVGVGAGGAIEGEDAADVGNLWAEACGMAAAGSAATLAATFGCHFWPPLLGCTFDRHFWGPLLAATFGVHF